ncbi:hypothetical protein AAMO2058_001115500 [Amorphochlora amoebiformis]
MPATHAREYKSSPPKPKRRKVGDSLSSCKMEISSPTSKNSQNLPADCRPGSSSIPLCPQYRPTEIEFSDFHAYIKKIAPEASRFGLCKVIPPRNWKAPEWKKPIENLKYKRQTVQYASAVGAQISWAKCKEISWENFRRKALHGSQEFKKCEKDSDMAHFEKDYWDWIKDPKRRPSSVLYASDQDFSLFSQSAEGAQWNLAKIPTLKKSMLKFLKQKIHGVTMPYTYIGSRFSSFCWHVEDDLLYSMSYLYAGRPKIWYGVPSSESDLMDKAYRRCFRRLKKEHTLAKRNTIISPYALARTGIHVCRALHKQGEFMITFPNSFHCGFNTGLNYAEAVNFADEYWIPHGSQAYYERSKLGRLGPEELPPVIPFHMILFKAAKETMSNTSKCLKPAEKIRLREFVQVQY